MDELILKYLKKEMTLEEQHKLRKWVDEDPQHAKELRDLELFWKASDDAEIMEAQQRVWEKLQQNRSPNFGENDLKTARVTKNRMAIYLRIAAVLIIGFFLVHYLVFNPQTDGLIFSKDTSKLIEKTSLAGQKITFTLPDGTKVKLNADTRLIYPDQFQGDFRNVELIGEAFFDVKRDESKPFIITTQKLDVKVLGTSFNVRSYDDDNEVKVAVRTGKVAVNTDSAQEILNPTEMLVYNKESSMASKVKFVDQEVFAWKDKTLYFRDRSLSSVLKELERWYGVTINVSGSMSDQEDLTATYENKPLEAVLEGLAFIYGFDYEITESQINIQL